MTWSLWIRAQALVSSVKYVRRFTAQVFISMTSKSVWFSNPQPISLWKCNKLICDSHSALLMHLSIGGWSLVWEIGAPHSNRYPTGYYGCLLIAWWSIDWLIAWKVELWTWWARQQTQENPGKCWRMWMAENDLWQQKYLSITEFWGFSTGFHWNNDWKEIMHKQNKLFPFPIIW